MKKILLGLAIGLLSFSSYSSELKCSESYDIFQGIISGAVEGRRNSDLKQIKTHNGRYDYPALFDKNHPEQFYLYGWMNESKYDNTHNYFSYMIKSGKSKGHKAILLKPKADFISSVGEVCIIPTYYFVNIDEKQGGSLTDVFCKRYS